MSDVSDDQKTVSPEVLMSRVSKMYKKESFIEKYTKDMVVTTVLFLAVLSGVAYFIADANMSYVRKSWKSYRCNPLVMPVAGFINAPQNMDKSEYTSQNFNFCASEMFKVVFYNVILVFYYMVEVVTNIFKQSLESVHQFRLFLVNLKTQFLKFVIETVESIVNFIIPFINILIKLKDMMRKMEGVFLSIIYMLGGAYLALKSLFGTILTLCIIIIVVLLVILIIMWVMVAVFWAVPFLVPFHPPILIAATTFTITVVIIVILFSIVAAFCAMVFKVNSSVPKVKAKAQSKMDEHGSESVPG
jgi:hypothetical protein